MCSQLLLLQTPYREAEFWCSQKLVLAGASYLQSYYFRFVVFIVEDLHIMSVIEGHTSLIDRINAVKLVMFCYLVHLEILTIHYWVFAWGVCSSVQ